MGVSKGGVATLNAAIAVRQRWRRGFSAPVRPACRDLPGRDRPAPRSDHPRPADLLHAGRRATTTRPRRLPSTMPSACARPATAASRSRSIAAPITAGSRSGRCSTSRTPRTGRAARTSSRTTDSHYVVAAGRAMTEPEYQAWARLHCVTRGARAGGGTPELKARATADLLAFLGRPRLRRGKSATGVGDFASMASRRELQARCG